MSPGPCQDWPHAAGPALVALALACLAACGRLGYDVDHFGTRCDWRDGVRLSAPERLAALASAADEVDPFLDPDGRTLYFSSDRDGRHDVYEAVRAVGGGPFGPPTRRPESSPDHHDYSFGVSADGRIGTLASDRPGGRGGIDIWLGHRDDTDGPFEDMWSLGINSALDDHDPRLTADARALWFAPMMPDGPQALMVSRRNGASLNFATPRRVEELASDAGEADPSLTDDQLVVVFTSRRGGATDLWYAIREAADLPFEEPRPVPDIGSDAADGQPFVRGDGCEIFWSSRRPGGAGGYDLFRADFLP